MYNEPNINNKINLYVHAAMVKEKWLEQSIDIEETSKFKCEH